MYECTSPSKMLKKDDYTQIVSSVRAPGHKHPLQYKAEKPILICNQPAAEVGLIYQGRQKLLQNGVRRRGPKVAPSHLHAPLIPGPCWPQASPHCGLC